MVARGRFYLAYRSSSCMGSPRPPSTITHVALSGISGKGRIDWLKATFRCYVKMEGTKDRTHPFPQLPSYVIIPTHPSSPPLIFTYVKTSEKHRLSQDLLAMSVFSFSGQDRVTKNKIARFCQIKSRQSREGGWDFEARMGAWRPCKLWAGGSG